MADFNFDEAINSFVSAAKGVAGVVADRAVQGYDLGKNEYDLQLAERDLSRYYKSFGRLMYQIEKGQLKRDDNVVANGVAQITETLALISSLKEKTKEIKAREINFKTESTPKDPREDFEEELDKASAQVEECAGPDDDAMLMMKICPMCKAENAPDASFCSSCGHEF